MSRIAKDLNQFTAERTSELKKLIAYYPGLAADCYKAELEVNKLAIEAYLAHGEHMRWMGRALRAEGELERMRDHFRVNAVTEDCPCGFCTSTRGEE
jgi:hypothetical protein